MKRDLTGYTSDVIRVRQHTTERHGAAHASLLIPSTSSYRQLLLPCVSRERVSNKTSQAASTLQDLPSSGAQELLRTHKA